MNAILNIQIKIAAQQAQQVLNQVNSAINKLGSGSSGANVAKGLTSGITLAKREVDALNKSIKAAFGGVGASSNVGAHNQQLAAASRQQVQQSEQAQRQMESVQKAYLRQQVSNAKDAVSKEKGILRELVTAQKQAAQDVVAAQKPQLTALGRMSEAISGPMEKSKQGLIQMGKNMQWVGRQINFNFTLPILYAGHTVLGWALDNERAFTRVARVYGGAKSDLEDLRKSFEALSSIYGVAQSEVDDLGAAWAAAGVQGADLGKVVKTSLDLSILGNYASVGDTFTDLVTVMGAFNLTADQLGGTVAMLNRVDNEAATTLPDLVAGIARAGGAATVTGVPIRELIAMIASISPSAGSAASAGNALKTVFTKLAVPTEAMNSKLKAVGVNTDSLAWKTGTASQRLQALADVFGKAPDSQKAFISSIAGNLFQVNKLDVLLGQLSDKTSNYYKILASIAPDAATTEANFKKVNAQVELLLKSDPSQLAQLTNDIKNMLTDAIQPLIPAVIGLVSWIRAGVQWFTHLSPTVQKSVLALLLFVVAVGVIAQAVGSFQLLIGVVAKFFIFFLTHVFGMETAAVQSAAAQVAAAEATTAAVEAQSLVVEAATASQIAAQEALALAIAGVTAEILASYAARTGAAGESALAMNLASVAAGAGEAAEATMVISAATAEVLAQSAEAAAAGASAAATIAAVLAVIAIIVVAVVLIVKYHNEIWHFLKFIGLAIADFFKMVGLWVWGGIKEIGKAFAALANIIGQALMAVLRTVAAIITKIIDWLSYLNPFARHSPSLVDNVKSGISAIITEYGRLASIRSVKDMADDLQSFSGATNGVLSAAKQKGRAETVTSVASVAPGAIPALQQLFNDEDQLQSAIDQTNAAISAQTAIVKPLKDAYDAASAAVDLFSSNMQPLRDQVDADKTALDAAKSALDAYKDVHITGMKAAADATFENTMAQKRLQLQIMDLTDAGQGLDDIANQIALVNGAIENLQGKTSTLRNAGAGSDILSTYQGQVDILKDQKNSLEVTAKAGADLQKQLDILTKQGQRMDLENSINFDPLIHQIETLMSDTKELSFNDIIKGITEQKGVVEKLTTAYDEHKAALDAQQTILDDMILKRDVLKASYDAEDAKLTVLNDTLSQYKDQLSKIEDAIDAVVSAQSKLKASTGGGGKAAKDSGLPDAFDFQDLPPLPTNATDDLLSEFRKKLEEQMKNIFKMPNPFAKIKEWWNDIVGWFKDIWHAFEDLTLKIAKWIFDFAATLSELPGKIIQWGLDIGNYLMTLPEKIWGWIKDAGSWLLETGKKLIGGLVDGIEAGWHAVVSWFSGLPDKIIQYGKGAALWLREAGNNILKGIDDGVKEGIPAFFAMLHKIPGWVVEGIGSALKWLWHLGGDLLDGLWEGITKGIPALIKLLGKLGGMVIDGLVAGAKAVWPALQTFFGSILPEIIRILGNVGGWLLDVGGKIMSGMWTGLKIAAKLVWDFITQILPTILGLLGDAALWLQKIGWDIILGLLAGIGGIVISLWNFFAGILGNILNILGDVGSWLIGVGESIVTGLWHGLLAIWDGAGGVMGWIGGWLGNILDKVGNALLWLVQKGKDIVQGLLNGIINLFNDVIAWFKALPGNIVSIIGNVSETLLEKGKNILQGLWDGMISLFGDILAWFLRLPNTILGAIGNLSETLLGVGGDLIRGLWNGVKSGLNMVGGIVGDIAGAIGRGIKAAWNGLMDMIPDITIPIPLADDYHVDIGNMLKLHSGGIVPGVGEVDTILKAGEMVLTRLQQSQLFALANGRDDGRKEVSRPNFVKNEINFYGDLSFPNITDPADAEGFMRNMEALAGSKV